MSHTYNETRSYGLIAVCTPVFMGAAFFASLRLEYAGVWGALFISAFLTACAAALVLLLRHDVPAPFFIAAAAAIILRILSFDTETSDYTNFLMPWVEHMRSHGNLQALGSEFGNYNVPYLVFLGIFSYSKFSQLYLIKLLSVFFDVALSWVCVRLTGLFTQNPVRKGVCLVLSLFMPTFFINGAVWGQCDSIYAFFALLSLYLCLSGRPVLSMASVALSFAFKLQAIFIMPVFLPMIFSGRLKWRHLPVFPAVYFLAVSPAILAGRGVWDTLAFYLKNASTAGDGLNYNSPSMYSLYYFYRLSDTSRAARAGIAAAFVLCVVVFLVFFIRRRHISRLSLLFAAFVFSLCIPLLLPHMHERYFYLCSALALVWACVLPSFALAVSSCEFASLLGYYAYFNMRYLLPMRLGFAAAALTALAALYFTGAELFMPRPPSSKLISEYKP